MKGYRMLAGAIIAQAMADHVDLLIFIRDIRKPDNEDLVYKRANKAYKKYLVLMSRNEGQKRKHRKEIAESKQTIATAKESIAEHEAKIAEITVEEPTEAVGVLARVVAMKKAKEAKKEIHNHEKSIAASRDLIERKEVNIAFLRDRIAQMRKEEKDLLRESSQRWQRKDLLRRARYEIDAIEDWILHSDQFVRLNAVQNFNPQALIELSYRKVRGGLQHPSNKWKPYFLQGDGHD